MLKIKRIYEKPEKNDGIRVLVDRLWPRGLTREKAKIDYWMKDIAPSNVLRKWFSHKEERWEEFKKRYFEELKSKKDILKQLKDIEKNKKITLLFGTKDKEKNNARALCDFLNKIKGCVLDKRASFIEPMEEVSDMADNIQTLDLRPMPPFERHEKIFQIWDTLKPGQTLRIINDHDPKPLWYQFEVEYKDRYKWGYEKKGPEDWIVKIERV